VRQEDERQLLKGLRRDPDLSGGSVASLLFGLHLAEEMMSNSQGLLDPLDSLNYFCAPSGHLDPFGSQILRGFST
jgi:hypothetical protein